MAPDNNTVYPLEHNLLENQPPVESIPLLEDEGSEDIGPPSQNGGLSADFTTSKLARLVRTATIIILACTMADLAMLLLLGVRIYTNSAIVNSDIVSSLELRTSYAGLESLYSTTTTPTSKLDPIINHARTFIYVSASEPHKTFPLYTKAVSTGSGVVPVDQRRLVVTREMSTIVQFRVLDFGMELCSLSAVAPPVNASSDIIAGSVAGTVHLDVWSLASEQPLQPQKISWATRPRRKTYLGLLPVSYGATNQLPSFPCLSGTYHAFELSCPTSECHVDLIGDGSQESGLYIQQYQTV